MQNPLASDIKRQIYANRKSFTPAQEQQILKVVNHSAQDIHLLCMLLYVTGCRVSEALELRNSHIDTDENLVVLQTRKQRGQAPLRAVPVPRSFILKLLDLTPAENGKFWDFSRWTARRRIKEILLTAGVPEELANTKTFRHSYNDRGKLQGTPDYVRRALLGHKTQSANDHYGFLFAGDLRDHAQCMWGGLK